MTPNVHDHKGKSGTVRRSAALLCALVALLALAACAPAPSGPAASPATPVPAPTPTLTATPIPTLTQAPTPGELIRDSSTLALPEGARSWALPGTIVGEIAYSPADNRLAVATSMGILLYQTNPLEQQARIFVDSGISSLAWSPDGTMLTAGTQGSVVRTWDVARGQELSSFKAGTNPVWDMAWSPNGQRLAIVVDGKVQVRDPATGEVLVSPELFNTYSSVAWSPDGAMLAGGSMGGALEVWDAATGREAAVTMIPMEISDEVHCVAWSPDGRWLASGAGGGLVVIWAPVGGGKLTVLTDHAEAIDTIAWSPDGKRLASGSGFGGSVQLWDPF